MATYYRDLLSAAEYLLARRAGQRGRLSQARIRRSISTSYYAIFHFLSEEAAERLIGSSNDLRRRRRNFARSFTHTGMNKALGMVRGANVEKNAAEFLRAPGIATAEVPSPQFARFLASVFSDAQAKRHDADYDMNEELSEFDARFLLSRVKGAIAGWGDAHTATDREFKHALCMLMLLKGQLRKEG